MKSIRVNILGKAYPLKVHEQDEQMMVNIAAYVDQRLRDFKRELVSQPEHTVMVLAALSLAEELFLEQRKPKVDVSTLPKPTDNALPKVNEELSKLLTAIKSAISDIDSK